MSTYPSLLHIFAICSLTHYHTTPVYRHVSGVRPFPSNPFGGCTPWPIAGRLSGVRRGDMSCLHAPGPRPLSSRAVVAFVPGVHPHTPATTWSYRPPSIMPTCDCSSHHRHPVILARVIQCTPAYFHIPFSVYAHDHVYDLLL